MQITVEGDSAVLAESPEQNFGVPHRRIRFSYDRSVLSVQISARQGAPIVAHDHAIRVEHWNQFENKFRPQFLKFNYCPWFSRKINMIFALAGAEFPVMKSIKPFIINEAGVSPG